MVRPEMAEVGRNEFVFGENGGRGAPASTFFRRIASISSAADDAEADAAAPRVVGGFSHVATMQHAAGSSRSSKSASKGEAVKAASKASAKTGGSAAAGATGKSKSKRRSQQGAYFDLDDDWDVNVEDTYESPIHGGAGLAAGRRGPGAPSAAERAALNEVEVLNSAISRIMRFEAALDAPTVPLDQLRRLAYSGVPTELRPRTWQHLLGYLPNTAERRDRALARKRQEYLEGVDQVFGRGLDKAMWHQISIDVPRTNPHIRLYSRDATQRALERVLYLWAIRHPASGYVQGINDLATPFYQTFLAQYMGFDGVEEADPGTLPEDVRNAVEADTYWCLSKLLDGIQDNYIHAQPGIHKQVAMLQDLCQRIDGDLARHLQSEGIEFMQFSFRWMNCLLMREVPLRCAIRIWDTYLAEGSHGFSEFHVYVCAAFLVRWAKELKTMDFQDIMIFLQSLPTQSWGDKEVELILSEAYMWQSLFKNAVAHLK